LAFGGDIVAVDELFFDEAFADVGVLEQKGGFDLCLWLIFEDFNE
jgi:hypothetical protein